MEKKTITIQTNTVKKGRLDQRSFSCCVYENEGTRAYQLDETGNDLVRKHFTLSPGCRIIDDGKIYFIDDIKYPPRPSRPLLIVDPTITI